LYLLSAAVIRIFCIKAAKNSFDHIGGKQNAYSFFQSRYTLYTHCHKHTPYGQKADRRITALGACYNAFAFKHRHPAYRGYDYTDVNGHSAYIHAGVP